jgi:hypothetical protein
VLLKYKDCKFVRYKDNCNSTNALLSSDGFYELEDGIRLYDSFGKIKKENDPLIIEQTGEFIDEPDSENISTRASYSIDTTPKFYAEDEYKNSRLYNLNTYQWKAKTVLETVSSWLFGKDYSRSNEFDSKHRVELEVFKVSYVFYATVGLKVKMKKRKSFLGIKYWVGTKCDKIAVGVENLTGKMKFNYNPGTMYPADIARVQIGNYVAGYIYTGANKGGWIEDLIGEKLRYTFVGGWIPNSININAISIRPWDFLKKLPRQEAYKLLNSIYDKHVVKPAKFYDNYGHTYQMQDFYDPRTRQLIVYDGNKSIETHTVGFNIFNGPIESKTIRFSQSGGFSLSFKGAVYGYIPEFFDMSNFKIFGAAYYNGKWRGVRFTN